MPIETTCNINLRLDVDPNFIYPINLKCNNKFVDIRDRDIQKL